MQFPLGGLNSIEVARRRNLPERREQPFRVASIGRLEALKGLGLGLMAFAAVHNDLPESEYWIVGDGPERPALERLARLLGYASHVQFRCWVPRGSVPETLAQVDVLVHPSLHEQFGYVVLEAMAAGRPVVCLRPARFGRWRDCHSGVHSGAGSSGASRGFAGNGARSGEAFRYGAIGPHAGPRAMELGASGRASGAVI